FAKGRREESLSIAHAARSGAEHRLRAVLLPALGFICGIRPLAMPTGAGAGAGQAIGVTILGGMVGATTVGLFIIPTLFVAVQWAAEGGGRRASIAAERRSQQRRKA